MIKQAIIPLAGLGTRLLPLTSVFAKELLPINGRPGIEYILDECIEAGIKEIIFIISAKKEIIKKRNIANSGAIVFEAKEDEIVIFPSKTSHQTQPNVKNNDRISLSADIFIAAKNSENMEHLVTPFKNWKTL